MLVVPIIRLKLPIVLTLIRLKRICQNLRPFIKAQAKTSVFEIVSDVYSRNSILEKKNVQNASDVHHQFVTPPYALTCMWPASLQIHVNKRKRLHEKRPGRKEFNPHNRFWTSKWSPASFVLEHQYDRRDVIWRHFI